MGNRLSKISTKTGDDGTTGLSDGTRVVKEHPRIEAIGAVDELNSFIGLLLTYPLTGETNDLLTEVQHHLFNLGGGLSMPDAPQLLGPEEIRLLDDMVEKFNAELPPLKEFILPGGDRATATCHVARSVCRRAERRVTALMRHDKGHAVYVQYLNRLSDLLFIMARQIGRHNGTQERLWRGRSSPE